MDPTPHGGNNRQPGGHGLFLPGGDSPRIAPDQVVLENFTTQMVTDAVRSCDSYKVAIGDRSLAYLVSISEGMQSLLALRSINHPAPEASDQLRVTLEELVATSNAELIMTKVDAFMYDVPTGINMAVMEVIKQASTFPPGSKLTRKDIDGNMCDIVLVDPLFLPPRCLVDRKIPVYSSHTDKIIDTRCTPGSAEDKTHDVVIDLRVGDAITTRVPSNIQVSRDAMDVLYRAMFKIVPLFYDQTEAQSQAWIANCVARGDAVDTREADRYESGSVQRKYTLMVACCAAEMNKIALLIVGGNIEAGVITYETVVDAINIPYYQLWLRVEGIFHVQGSTPTCRISPMNVNIMRYMDDSARRNMRNWTPQAVDRMKYTINAMYTLMMGTQGGMPTYPTLIYNLRDVTRPNAVSSLLDAVRISGHHSLSTSEDPVRDVLHYIIAKVVGTISFSKQLPVTIGLDTLEWITCDSVDYAFIINGIAIHNVLPPIYLVAPQGYSMDVKDFRDIDTQNSGVLEASPPPRRNPRVYMPRAMASEDPTDDDVNMIFSVETIVDKIRKYIPSIAFDPGTAQVIYNGVSHVVRRAWSDPSSYFLHDDIPDMPGMSPYTSLYRRIMLSIVYEIEKVARDNLVTYEVVLHAFTNNIIFPQLAEDLLSD